MLVYYFVPFIVSNRYLLFWVSNGHNSVTVQNRTHVYMNFFHHKDLGNHLLQLCPKVVKHYIYTYIHTHTRVYFTFSHQTSWPIGLQSSFLLVDLGFIFQYQYRVPQTDHVTVIRMIFIVFTRCSTAKCVLSCNLFVLCFISCSVPNCFSALTSHLTENNNTMSYKEKPDKMAAEAWLTHWHKSSMYMGMTLSVVFLR